MFQTVTYITLLINIYTFYVLRYEYFPGRISILYKNKMSINLYIIHVILIKIYLIYVLIIIQWYNNINKSINIHFCTIHYATDKEVN